MFRGAFLFIIIQEMTFSLSFLLFKKTLILLVGGFMSFEPSTAKIIEKISDSVVCSDYRTGLLSLLKELTFRPEELRARKSLANIDLLSHSETEPLRAFLKDHRCLQGSDWPGFIRRLSPPGRDSMTAEQAAKHQAILLHLYNTVQMWFENREIELEARYVVEAHPEAGLDDLFQERFLDFHQEQPDKQRAILDSLRREFVEKDVAESFSIHYPYLSPLLRSALKKEDCGWNDLIRSVKLENTAYEYHQLLPKNQYQMRQHEIILTHLTNILIEMEKLIIIEAG